MKLTTASKLQEVSPPNIADSLLQKAATAINRREVYIVSFSGKQGSGKDTFADSYMKNYQEVENKEIAKTAFADHVKGELTSMITYFESYYKMKHRHKTFDEMIHDFSIVNNMTTRESENLFDILKPAISKKRILNLNNESLSGWSRTPEVRKAQQFLGTEVRQNQDQIYWVRRTVQHILSNASNGISTVVSDTRFLHEIGALELIGGYNIRIDITPETQRERIKHRDNIYLTEEALNHRSETELDNYSNFNQRVDNNSNDLSDTLSNSYTRWMQERDEPFNGK